MSKKLILACLALVALAAFALPAAASAANDPDLTCDQGSNTLCAAGTKVIGHNVGVTKMTNAAGTQVLTECSTALMTGSVVSNLGTGTLTSNITSAFFGGTGTKKVGQTEPECTGTFGGIDVTAGVAGGLPWCVSSTAAMAEDEFQVRGGLCSEAARGINFTLDSTTAGECAYTRALAIPGTYTTEATGDAIMSITTTKFTKSAGGILCPGEGFLDMTFTLETDVNANADNASVTNTVTAPLGIS